jgi:hypothetical protein
VNLQNENQWLRGKLSKMRNKAEEAIALSQEMSDELLNVKESLQASCST